ncbi:hypothetical protein Gotri_024915, partial [Gossypium trilobum]|nr:hypothetical protein [Gossypium trilobum]
ESNLRPHNLSHYNKLWVWRSIVHPLTTNDSISKSFVDNPKILAGNDEKINFWAGCWVREFLLKSIFSRVFALAVKKVGNIVDFGFWLDGKWVWHVEHKRPFFIERKSSVLLLWVSSGENQRAKLWKLVWAKLAPRTWNSSFGYWCMVELLNLSNPREIGMVEQFEVVEIAQSHI